VSAPPVLALSGGVGGAKLAHGLAQLLPPGELVIVANTGDDFEHLGLTICPDVDTILYTLAGLADPRRGWGITGETWHFMDALRHLGGPGWFRLGDRDLATHVVRTQALARGETLSQVIAGLAARLGIRHEIVPMTDAPVRTRLDTDDGVLDFQDWFVRRACAPRVRRIEYSGASAARPSPALAARLRPGAVRAVVLCPSNPYLSIDPILAIPGVRDALARLEVPVIAVSPIVGGAALKGPAARLLVDLAGESSVEAIARHYRGLVHTLAIDRADCGAVDRIAALGITPLVLDAVMRTEADRARLAAAVLEATCRRRAS
jgi:LPPG:FO 2-phospho-L-lactate transferase